MPLLDNLRLRPSYGLHDEQRNGLGTYKCLGVQSYATDLTFDMYMPPARTWASCVTVSYNSLRTLYRIRIKFRTCQKCRPVSGKMDVRQSDTAHFFSFCSFREKLQWQLHAWRHASRVDLREEWNMREGSF